ncbi:HTH-type transcriptional regulator ImmR [Paenibacillus konkukensis]|uniref:HTH-type transcriptional regulator ImmR n=1 Tax=Paenibacillus konkukensis TaxID=2020716 RepID=A0ABY4RN84_9BACL|nr:HTH-type transcriptional regulator ImmR [Paenibacillus konkukensis]
MKEALKRAGHTQNSAREVLGLSKNAVNNYARGRIPDATILLRLSQLCGVSMEWLLTGVEREVEKEKVENRGFDISPEEYELILKLRSLDVDNQEEAIEIIERKYARLGKDAQNSRKRMSSNSQPGAEDELSAGISDVS